jgi:hypothetical protein
VHSCRLVDTKRDITTIDSLSYDSIQQTCLFATTDPTHKRVMILRVYWKLDSGDIHPNQTFFGPGEKETNTVNIVDFTIILKK